MDWGEQAELQLGPGTIEELRERERARAGSVFINSIQYAVKIFQLQQRQGSLRVNVVEQVARCGSASLGLRPRVENPVDPVQLVYFWEKGARI